MDAATAGGVDISEIVVDGRVRNDAAVSSAVNPAGPPPIRIPSTAREIRFRFTADRSAGCRCADERPCLAIENPVTITDLHATLFTAMGISPKTVYEIEGRPFYATEDGKGTPVKAVFA